MPEVEPGQLWYIHGKAYDLTSFAKRHPGGEAALLKLKGRECSAEYDAAHLGSSGPERMLKRLKHVDLPQDVMDRYLQSIITTTTTTTTAHSSTATTTTSSSDSTASSPTAATATGDSKAPEEQLMLKEGADEDEEEVVVLVVSERTVRVHGSSPASSPLPPPPPRQPASSSPPRRRPPTPVEDRVDSAKGVDPDELWYIHGKAYDLRDFIHQHPGGSDALLWTQGRDATALFESYHPFTDKPANMLQQMKQVAVPSSVLRQRVRDVSFNGWFHLPGTTTPDPFWAALRERCGKKLREAGVPRTMPWWDLSMQLGFLALYLWLYCYAYLGRDFSVAMGAAAVMGLLAWMLVRLGHDGLHRAVSRHEWVNRVCGWLGFMGTANPAMWEYVHNVHHHADTNLLSDPDMYHYTKFLQLHPDYPRSMLHRLQAHRLYVYALWAFTVWGLCIESPWRMIRKGHGTFPEAPGTRMVKHRPRFWVPMVLHFVGFLFFTLALPFLLLWPFYANKGWLVLRVLVVFNIYVLSAGNWFALFSQVNHFPEGAVAATFKPTSWAQQQVETTANFRESSFVWGIVSAAINIQIEHHLFPSISAHRLRLLWPIVRDTCHEFGVEYKSFGTYRAILASTHRYLGSLADNPDLAKEFAMKGRQAGRPYASP